MQLSNDTKNIFKGKILLFGMVSRQSRERMREYVAGRLESSGIHVAKDVSRDCLQLQTNSDKSAYVYLHTSPEGAEDYIHTLHKLVHQGDFVTNVFYKDGKNFFVLIDEAKKPVLARTTLKNYSLHQISEMIHLREKERELLRIQGPKRLVYYQPDNTSDGGRLSEGLVSFQFLPVHASYSHVSPSVKGYDLIMANDGRVLKTLAISENKTIIDGDLKLLFSKRSPHLPILGSSSISASVSSRSLSVSPTSPSGIFNESIRYFLNQTGTTLEGWGGRIEDIVNYLLPR